MEKMKIEIWSDIACPYCYIGKRKLDIALSNFPHSDEVELVWHSYELNPSLLKGINGITYSQYISQMHDFSDIETEENNNKLVSLAKSVGLEYNLDKIVVTNTSDALRLVKLAKQYGLANEAEEALFKAYFIDGENISDHNILIRLGKNIGISEDKIKELLDSDLYLDEIKKDIEFSENELGLEYIPFYVFNNKHIIQGSIPSEEYLKVLEKAYDEWKQQGVSDKINKDDIISGQSCSIDGVCN